MPTTIFDQRRYDFTVAEMVSLHALLRSAMDVPSGMPDAAMDALIVSHNDVLKELIVTPCSNRHELTLKRSVFATMTFWNDENAAWAREIEMLSQSIEADSKRFSGLYLIAAE